MRTGMSSYVMLTTMARWVKLANLVTVVSCTVNTAVVVLASSVVNGICVCESEQKSKIGETQESLFMRTYSHSCQKSKRYRFYLSRELPRHAKPLSLSVSHSFSHNTIGTSLYAVEVRLCSHRTLHSW